MTKSGGVLSPPRPSRPLRRCARPLFRQSAKRYLFHEVGLGGMKRRLELSDPCLVALCQRLRPLEGLARLVNRFPGNGLTLL